MKTLYFFLTLLFVSFLATGGIFVKLSELAPVNTAFYRVLLSIPMIYPLLKFGHNNPLVFKDKLLLFIAGFFLAGDLVLWNISFHHTTVANANLLANLVPFTIIPVSYFLYKEKVSKSFFVCLGILLIGLYILINGKETINESNLFGDILAFLTSIFYAAFLLIVYKVRERASAMQIMYYSAYGSVVILLISSIVMEGLAYPTSMSQIIPILGLTIFSQILGQGGLSYVLGKISANIASILVLMQPVISAIYAYLIFDENLSYQEILGIFIILIGIFFVKVSK